MSATYDVVFTSSGTDYSYMCRQKGDTKDFRVSDAPLLPQTLVTGSASPSNIDPTREIQISQVDWRRGFQDVMFDDEYKYNESENCDARMKGEVTLPPKKLTALQLASAETTPTMDDGSFESWQDATTPHASWTEAGDDITRTTTHHGDGTYGAYQIATNQNLTGTLTQEVIAADSIATFKGMIAQVSVWGYTTGDGSGYFKIKFDDGDDTTESANNTSGSWNQTTIRHRISDSATKLDVQITMHAMVGAGTHETFVDDCEFEVLVDYVYNRAVPDGGLENWTDGSTHPSWVLDDGEWSRDGDNQRTGTYCLQLTEDGGGAEAHVDLPFNATNDQSRDFYLVGYCYQSGAPAVCRIGINDGVDTTWSETISAAAYTCYVVKKTLGAAATRLRIMLDVDDANGDDLYIDDVEMLTSSVLGSATKMVEFGDEIVVASGTSLLKVNGSTDLTFLMDFDTITDLCVFGNRLYIAQGWSHDYWYTSDLSSFTAFTDSATHPKYFANIGGSVMICAAENNVVKSSDNPINDGTAWSGDYTVGSDDYDITGLVDHEDTWYVRKEDDVYYLSGSDVYSLMDIDAETSTTYTYGIHRWGDNLYIGSGVNSLYEYDVSASTATTISPTRYAQGDANYDEDVIAMAHDESYLYVALDNGSDVKILAGRWETVEGSTDWYWHPLYDITMNDITCMLVSSKSGSKRLYVGTNTYTDGIIPFIVPVGYAQPYTESGYECEASGNFITPWYRSNFPTETKYWKSVDVTSICCTDKTSITAYYQKKGGSWTSLGSCTTSAYSGGYPDETTDSFDIDQSSERVRFKFAMAAADDDYTPILYGTGGGIVVYGILQPTAKKQIEATIQLAPQIRLRDDTTEERTVSTDLTNLRALYSGGGTMTLTAPDETSYTVSFAKGGYQEQLAYDESMQQEVWWISVKLLED